MMFAGLLFTAVWLPGIAALSPTVRTSVDPKHDPNIVITVGKVLPLLILCPFFPD